jgi:hypothetical protein
MHHLAITLAAISAVLSAAYLSIGFQATRELKRHDQSIERRKYIKDERLSNFLASLVFLVFALITANLA